MSTVVKLLLALLVAVPLHIAIPTNVPPVPAQKYSSDDLCLAWVIDSEARGEPIKGQRAVYDVVKHRMEVRNLSACEVVKEPYQFSGFHRGMRLTATEEMLQRLDKVRKIPPVVSSATYFHSKDVKPTWASKMKKILTIGRHSFYVFRKPKEKKQ